MSESSDFSVNKDDGENKYGEKDLQHLSDKEHVRARPGMYIGDTGNRGLHHLVYEVVDNSIDEAMAGFAKNVTVIVNPDLSVTVEDDGRGIPVEKHSELSEKEGRDISTLEGVMTFLKFGGKFGKTAYQTSGGLHGVGVTVVNYLSEWCEVQVSRNGKVYEQEYERGTPTGAVEEVGESTSNGTRTTFKPDAQIFTATKFNYDTLRKRLQELAFLNQGVRIILKDERNGDTDEFQYENGLLDFIEHLNRAADPIHDDILNLKGEAVSGQNSEGQDEFVSYEVALQYTTGMTENLHSYVNNINTTEGGTHVSGFRSALTRTLNSYGKKEKLFKDLVPEGNDFREGLTVVISVRVPHPQFEGQTKTKLGNSEVETIVTTAFGEFLSKYMEENPRTAKAIIRKGLLAAEARVAAKKARELVQRKKGALTGGSLPGKLRDCLSRKAEECELYLVEGDSAGGSAEGGRLRDFQAILPLRGKIINAYKHRLDKVLGNEEVQSMIRAIGIGIGEDSDLTKRRYNKVIIMTDADIDGSHIRTLLLCFFYRQMYSLIEGGHVYIAQPPLFRVKQGRDVQYVQSEEEMRTQLMNRGLADASFVDPDSGKTVEGEQMEQLCKTLADLEERGLLPLERRGISLRDHVERIDPETGKMPMFHVRDGAEEHWFYSLKAKNEFMKKFEKPSSESEGEETRTASELDEEEGPQVTEMHEVRTINSGLKALAELGFEIEALLPKERTGLQTPRFLLRRGETDTELKDLRGLTAAVRSAGEKGMTVTRFKGLGEMNPEELRETTLDPDNRTLLKVNIEDAGDADTMFQILMGDKVEPRREFIEKHALEVKNLDV